jgi:hypothetical protein
MYNEGKINTFDPKKQQLLKTISLSTNTVSLLRE